MRARRSRRPPTPQKSALTVLLDRAGVDLAAKGAVRASAAPWLAAATVLLMTRRKLRLERAGHASVATGAIPGPPGLELAVGGRRSGARAAWVGAAYLGTGVTG